MAEDPTVDSIEVDCLEHAEMSLPQGDDSFPGGDSGMPDLDEAVARRLTVHDGAPWGLDRIDGVDDNSYDDGDLTGGGTGVRVYIVDSGIQGTHVDFGNRVVNGYTVRAAQVSACKGSSRPCYPRLQAPHSHHPTTVHRSHTHRRPNPFPCPSLLSQSRERSECASCQAVNGILPANGTGCSGHGTHVASTVGGLGYGVAKNVTLVPAFICFKLPCSNGRNGCASTSDIIASLEYVPRHPARPSRHPPFPTNSPQRAALTPRGLVQPPVVARSNGRPALDAAGGR